MRQVAWFQCLSCQLTLSWGQWNFSHQLNPDWSIQISLTPAVCKDSGLTPNNLTERPAALVYCVLHLCYDQLTPVKTRYPLTSITWLYRGLKLTAHRGHVFFWSWPLTRCCFFDWIAGSCLVGNAAGLFGKPVNAHPGLNVNQITTFSSVQTLCIWFYGDYWNSKQKAKQYTENLSAKLQNSYQNSTLGLG